MDTAHAVHHCANGPSSWLPVVPLRLDLLNCSLSICETQQRVDEAPKDYIGAISPQQLRFRSLDSTELVRITKHKLAGFEWLFSRISSRNDASFNCRVTNAP